MKNIFLKTGVISALLFTVAHSLAADSQFTVKNKANNNLASTKIVGGEISAEADWPWMTAFVVTFDEVATSLEVNNVSFNTDSFTNGASGDASAEMVDCGIGDAVCVGVTDKICLIQRGDVNFSEKADNCEAGGGIGAIIYNNVEGAVSGTMGDTYTGTIPVVAVTQEDGVSLLDQIGSVAILSVSQTSSLQQDSSCGATFLGDKWVLTAAHCIDTETISFFKMNVGEYDLSDGAENAIDIANVFVHPLYNDDSLDNDIALVELVSSVDAPAVQIAGSELTEQLSIEKSLSTVAGWGGRVGYEPNEGPTSDFPDILHQVDLNLMTNEQCNATLDSDGSLVTDNMICAAISEGGKGSCQGDSGGPLVVNTGSGVQQVGLVSWGIGCAAAGYPGVFTRVAQYTDWMNAITNGIAITQIGDFDIGFEAIEQTLELAVTNNSDMNVGLSFTIEGSGSFSLDDTNCATLDAGNSCQLVVSFLPTVANEETAEISITTDNAQVPTSSAIVTGLTLKTASELAANAGTDSDVVSFFSGGTNGASGWAANAIEGLESGTNDDLQDSILVALIEGKGELTFDWSVSSEENLDLEETDPDFEPYDALYLYVNGELIEYISGEVAFTQMSISLDAGTNIINWTYNKDPAALEGQDKGFIRNFNFVKAVVVVPVTPVTPTKSSGGGSISWLTLCLFGLVCRIRKKI